MQTFYDIYFGLLYDIPIALLLFRTVESKQTKPIPYYIKLIYCVILFFSSFFSSFLCFVILPLIYCIYVFSGKYQIALKHLIKFEFFYFVIFILLIAVYTIIFNDYDFSIDSHLYNTYKSAILNLMTYIIFVLTSNAKQITCTKNSYILFFNITIMTISITLGYTTLSLNLMIPDSTVLPVIFATIFVLIIICISLYNKFLAIIEENTNYRIKLELDKMEKEYSVQIDDKLKQLHSLRHDMKNHLIILYGYAAKNETDHICAYINRIADDLSLTNTVDSGSHIVSALIAEKERIAKSQNIRCDINISTPDINIDDFSITTIIGNLFDNAIKAASECGHGCIFLLLKL